MEESGRPVKPWKVWLWVAPLALLAGIWAVPQLLRPPAHEEEHEEEAPAAVVELVDADVVAVASQRLPDLVQATGLLEPLPAGRATVSAEVPGRLLDLSLKPGDVVAAGQVLARVARTDLGAEAEKADAAVVEAQREVAALQAQLPLQTGTLEAQLRVATAAREEAQAKLDRLRAGNRPEEIERAEAQLAAAKADLERLRNGARPQEVRQAEATLSQADAEVEVARKAAARIASLVEKGITAARERERAEADLARAVAQQAAAREGLALVRQGPRPEEIRAQEEKVHDAEAQLRLVRQGARPEEIREAAAAVAGAEAKQAETRAQRQQAEVIRAQVRTARQRVRQAEVAARAARSLERQAVVRAPIGGTVARVAATAGEVVQPGSPIAELENEDALRLLLQVPAAYQGRLRPGLPVTATLPHAPGVRYVGNLRTIQPAASAQTGTVTAEVWLPNHGRRLRAGLAVNAEIRLREGAAVPVVPIASVFAQEGEQYVYRLEEDGKIHQTQVTLGAERGASAPVLEGLRPGDRILRDGRRSVADESRFVGVAGEKPEEPPAEEGSKPE